MPGTFASIHVPNFPGLIVFLVFWILSCEGAHLLVMLLRREPMLGWAIGPFGVTVLFLHEPSLFYIWLDVLGPALVSGSVLYIGLFTAISPIALPQIPVVEILIIACGVIFTSSANMLRALRDLRHPLWGEARVLRTIQYLRAGWARIHFTSFGQSYLHDHFGSNPSDLLRAL